MIGSYTFSKVGMKDCARFIADRGVPVDRLFTDRWRIEQADEAYRAFDRQAGALRQLERVARVDGRGAALQVGDQVAGLSDPGIRAFNLGFGDCVGRSTGGACHGGYHLSKDTSRPSPRQAGKPVQMPDI